MVSIGEGHKRVVDIDEKNKQYDKEIVAKTYWYKIVSCHFTSEIGGGDIGKGTGDCIRLLK